jgi:pimeloyl-ACP methyl ester carboxylesterase
MDRVGMEERRVGMMQRVSRAGWAAKMVPCVALMLATTSVAGGVAPTQRDIAIRGKAQTLRVYGDAANPPVVVTSGDGGWIHLGPDVAERLVGWGYFVVGVDAKAYLSSFTAGNTTLTTADVPSDYRAFVDAARAGRERQVLLVGVSVGAGLSILAASRADLQPRLAGVIALGLPVENELGWRLRDSVIYLTKKTPNEPIFLAADIIPKVPPVPLAGLYSTRDEFVPAADAQRLFALPGSPKRIWMVNAENHRFSGNPKGLEDALNEALAWIGEQRAAAGANPFPTRRSK